jgi:NAD dependent epimerase/dehydratase
MELRNQTALVTGADGFLGSHLVEALVSRGVSVRAFVYYNAFNSFGWLDSLPEERLREIDVRAGDVRDPTAVEAAMRGARAVFHLAALIGVPFSYESPASYVDTNVKGTLHVLEAARKLGVERTLIVSSSEVYGTARYLPIDEEHPLQGQSPYSASKIGAEKLAEAFYRSFELPLVVVRPFNTYGPRQSARAVIPTIITQLLAGETEVRLGSLEPRRDFNYVKDTVSALIELACCDRCLGEVVNVASGVDVSIGELAQELVSRIRPEARVIHDAQRVRPRHSEVERLLGSNAKLRSLTGWTPDFDLKRGLTETIAWFRDPEHAARYKSQAYNR